MEYTLESGPDHASIFVNHDSFGSAIELQIKATSEGLFVEFWDDLNGEFIPVYTATYPEMAEPLAEEES